MFIFVTYVGKSTFQVRNHTFKQYELSLIHIFFDAQDQAYKEEVLPNAVRRRVAIEMAASLPWYKYVGLDGAVIGIDTFGASAPAAKIIEEYGFTVENIVEKVKGMN